MAEQRILIVGGGIAGVATAYFLARGGRSDVTLLEMERQPGVHSTGLNAGILRTWTGDDVNRLLAERSADFLRHPPAGFSEVPLVDPVGLVEIGIAGDALEQERHEAHLMLSRELVEHLAKLVGVDRPEVRRRLHADQQDGGALLLRACHNLAEILLHLTDRQPA